MSPIQQVFGNPDLLSMIFYCNVDKPHDETALIATNSQLKERLERRGCYVHCFEKEFVSYELVVYRSVGSVLEGTFAYETESVVKEVIQVPKYYVGYFDALCGKRGGWLEEEETWNRRGIGMSKNEEQVREERYAVRDAQPTYESICFIYKKTKLGVKTVKGPFVVV